MVRLPLSFPIKFTRNVFGLTLGSRIQDWPLIKISLKNEMLDLSVCVVIDAFVGLAARFMILAAETWPTN